MLRFCKSSLKRGWINKKAIIQGVCPLWLYIKKCHAELVSASHYELGVCPLCLNPDPCFLR